MLFLTHPYMSDELDCPLIHTYIRDHLDFPLFHTWEIVKDHLDFPLLYRWGIIQIVPLIHTLGIIWIACSWIHKGSFGLTLHSNIRDYLDYQLIHAWGIICPFSIYQGSIWLPFIHTRELIWIATFFIYRDYLDYPPFIEIICITPSLKHWGSFGLPRHSFMMNHLDCPLIHTWEINKITPAFFTKGSFGIIWVAPLFIHEG